MWLFEYDEKKHMEMERRDSEARGEARGKVIGETNRTIELIQRKLAKGESFEEACADLDLTKEEIREIKPSFDKKS